jgi:murein DD-endopeptidase MepM/ murein hydrolase activator NlpD
MQPFSVLAVTSSLMLCGVGIAAADTVYYQPTPYPKLTADARAMPQDINIVHLWDGWLGSQYYTTFFRDDKLQFGGWGDVYRAYVQFDLAGLPKNVTRAVFWFSAYNRGDSSTPTPFAVCKNIAPWSTAMSWTSQPKPPSSCAGWFAAPTPGNWWGLDVTPWYNGWQAQPDTNYGFYFMPQYNNNRFTTFRSSRYANDALRPIIQLDFTAPAGMPKFKMPLPAGYSWLVTTEAGGYDCKGPPADTAHQGANYFTVDFSARNRDNNGAVLSGNIPVLASAVGTVLDVGGSTSDGRGYYVTLSHSGGYQTRYLHFKQPAARKNGALLKKNDAVAQGDQIGIMGSTGKSTGTHLHFNLWLNDSGRADVAGLSYVVVDGWLIRSFQTECSVKSDVPQDWVRYYRSSNVPSGK